jgi:hypothetical protein
MTKWFRFISVVLIFFAAQSCSKNNVKTQKKLPHKSTSYLVEQLQENELKCDWFSAKLGVEFESDKMSDSFKIHVRLHKDSAIWISATYYSVEAARFLITPDTVKFMDRKNNKYFIGDFVYINEKFNVELDFESLQSLILGNGVDIAEFEKLKSYPANGLYHISSIGKRKQRKADKKGDDKAKTAVALTVSLSPETYKVSRLILQDFTQHKSLKADFEKYQKLDGQLVPERIKLNIVAEKNLDATIEYLKVTLNNPVKFSFTIPEKYEKMD